MKKIIFILSVIAISAITGVNAQILKTPCAMSDLNAATQQELYQSANAAGGYGVPAKIVMTVQPIVTPVTVQKDSVTTEVEYAVIYTDSMHVQHQVLLKGDITVKQAATGKLVLSGIYGDSKKLARLHRKWLLW